MNAKDRIQKLIKKGVLVSPDMIDQLENEDLLLSLNEDVAVLHKDLALISDKTINLRELEAARALAEKNRNYAPYNAILSFAQGEKKEDDHEVKILFSYNTPAKPRKPKDFIDYFNNRYKQLERILKTRTELQSVVSIGRLDLKGEAKGTAAIIGMVRDKQTTKNDNIMLTVEDPTGQVNIVITKNKPALFAQAKDIVMDEVLGIVGNTGNKIMFANNVIWPDVPNDNVLKKAPKPGYAAFISDIHVGSTCFLPEEFNRFLKWINGEAGSSAQKEIAKNIHYLFVVGDIVDGVGIYPDQKRELEIQDIYAQYKECARLLAKIPSRIKIIICPGNHDAMRLSEPQPAFTEEFSNPVKELPNVTVVSNPSLINIHASKDFPGIDVLMYHGYSFDYYVAHVDSIRALGGYDRADLIMKFLLQRRHVAPSYASTLYLPDPEKDNLVIEKVPDIFASGHIHKTSVSQYRNITLLSGSCWQSMTSFQEKMGHHPEPARVPIVNLQTREVKVLKFGA